LGDLLDFRGKKKRKKKKKKRKKALIKEHCFSFVKSIKKKSTQFNEAMISSLFFSTPPMVPDRHLCLTLAGQQHCVIPHLMGSLCDSLICSTPNILYSDTFLSWDRDTAELVDLST